MQYAVQDEGVKEAFAILEALRANDQLRREAEARIKAWRDEQDRMEGAREEGREEGKKEGAAFVARNMLAMHFSADLAARVTGLEYAEVEALQLVA